jgi:predicted aspartyl protease
MLMVRVAVRYYLTVGVVVFLIAPTVTEAKVSLSKDPTGHFIAPVFVNGRGPYPFMVDTGADRSAVYSWFAAAQALPKGKNSVISGATGNAVETTSTLRSISLDGHTIKDVDADTIPDRADGAKIAGVAGVDLLANRFAVIDPACGTLGLLPGGSSLEGIAGKDAAIINAGSIHGGKQFTFKVTLNRISGVAILDSGARATIINTTFARVAGLNIKAKNFTAGPTTRGATQQSVSSIVGPIGDVSVAGIVQRNVVARIVDLPAFDDESLSGKPVMNVGADLLRDLRLTVDFDHRRFGLARSLCAAPNLLK